MGRFLKHELSGWKAWEIIWLAAACTIITALSIHWGDDGTGHIVRHRRGGQTGTGGQLAQ